MDRKDWLEIGLFGAAGIALFFLFFRRHQTVSVQEIVDDRPHGLEYYIYNYPQIVGETGQFAPQYTPSQSTSGQAPTCGCSGDDIGFYPGVDAFSKYLSERLTGLLDKYQENVLSVLPDYFTQNLNVSVAGRSNLEANEFGGNLILRPPGGGFSL